MTIAELINWTWQAVASGIAGNAAYDSIKALLGSNFDTLCQYREQDKPVEFNQELQTLLETNQQLQEKLAELKQGSNSLSKIYIMGDLNGDNNFNQGNITITKG